MIRKSDADICMHYFNSDGSEADFCGNGARCLVLYCIARGLAKGTVKFRSRAGSHTGSVQARGVTITMKAPVFIRDCTIAVEGVAYSASLVDAGVPHAVIATRALGAVPLGTLGPEIRHHPAFAPDGANVDFVDVGGSAVFGLRTYERGVETETLACGSGCVAAALVLRMSGLAGDTVKLKVASGDTIEVEFPPEPSDEVRLTGPASIVFEGEIDLKELDHV